MKLIRIHGICGCGKHFGFHPSSGLRKILKRKGASEEQIKQMFMEME